MCVCVCGGGGGVCVVCQCVCGTFLLFESPIFSSDPNNSLKSTIRTVLYGSPPPTTTTTTPIHPSPTLGTAPSQVSRPGLWALVRGSHSGHCCRQERVIPLVPLTPQCHAECHATTLSPVLLWHVGPAPWRVPSQNGDVSWRLHALTVTSGSGQVCRRG